MVAQARRKFNAQSKLHPLQPACPENLQFAKQGLGLQALYTARREKGLAVYQASPQEAGERRWHWQPQDIAHRSQTEFSFGVKCDIDIWDSAWALRPGLFTMEVSFVCS